MKKITLFMACLLTLTLASCGSSYNEEKCDDLIDKYNEDGELSKKEIGEALDQYDAIIDKLDNEYDKILKKANKDKDEAKDMADDLEGESLFEHYANLSNIINSLDNRDEIKGDNKKKLKDLEKKDKELGKKAKKIAKKLYGIDTSNF